MSFRIVLETSMRAANLNSHSFRAFNLLLELSICCDCCQTGFIKIVDTCYERVQICFQMRLCLALPYNTLKSHAQRALGVSLGAGCLKKSYVSEIDVEVQLIFLCPLDGLGITVLQYSPSAISSCVAKYEALSIINHLIDCYKNLYRNPINPFRPNLSFDAAGRLPALR